MEADAFSRIRSAALVQVLARSRHAARSVSVLASRAQRKHSSAHWRYSVEVNMRRARALDPQPQVNRALLIFDTPPGAGQATGLQSEGRLALRLLQTAARSPKLFRSLGAERRLRRCCSSTRSSVKLPPRKINPPLSVQGKRDSLCLKVLNQHRGDPQVRFHPSWIANLNVPLPNMAAIVNIRSELE